jgi:hypothetical protein
MKKQLVVVVIHSAFNKGISMIHGIYLKSKPKNKWHLVSVAVSPETANQEVSECKKQAALDGHELAEVAIKIFDSTFWIPEFVDEIKTQEPLFN